MGGIDEIKSGDIFFTYDGSLVARIIRYVETGGHMEIDAPSHCGIIGDITHGTDGERVYTIEALWGRGVCQQNFQAYLKPKTKIWLARIQEPVRVEDGLRWAYTQFGHPYNPAQITAIFLVALVRWINSKMEKHVLLRKWLEKREAFICSELVSRYAIFSQHPIKEGNPDMHTPWDLLRSPEIEIYCECVIYKNWNSETVCATT